jgi:hypothetical protein
MIVRSMILGVMISASVGCQDQPERADTEKQAIRITNHYWAQELPQVDLDRLTVSAIEQKDTWKVLYMPDGGLPGDEWVFEVRKKDGKIVQMKGYQ